MTDTTDDTMSATLEAFMAGYLRLHAALGDTAEAQWKPSRHPVAREDTSERSKGLVNDPTVSIFIDTGRRRLRRAVIEAETAMAEAFRTLRVAEARLQKALEA